MRWGDRRRVAAPSVRARYEARRIGPAPDGPIAQLAEHRADNAGVSGAIPLRPTIISNPFARLLFDRVLNEPWALLTA